MVRWITYLKERFPLPTYILLVGGISLSGLYLNHGSFALIPFFISFFGLILFFALLRLMDELKDFEKDKIAHPDRPLPRGLLQKKEVSRTINRGEVSLLVYSLLIFELLNFPAALAYVFLAIYLWLMYREFYLGEWLVNRPFLYAISHQGILFLIAAFAVAVNRPLLIAEPSTLAFGLLLLGSFFTYEVCRKWDPQAHPILQTYLHIYGYPKTFLIVVGASIVASIGAYFLGYHYILWTCEGIVLIGLALACFIQRLYKLPEVLASLSLLVHVWVAVVFHWL